ncbi:RNA 2'-phosphotransferase [Acidaminobacter sp. JC074]|uniref:RNA 2'-phosphotransferase n=1 Tax=Acidaminobacter sp. JC074 TaxID=2530199 RepID=UPI001F0DEFB2|nr:RNA 2'-phosphotransferase [Acidaminobacter sp. JC074]MCH4886014.1 RNA 2'-phosphotransferase [Acidaminobacter sp. JC074]
MRNDNKMSIFLSLILRHKPEVIDIELDAEGWCPVEELIEKINKHGKKLDFERLKRIVDEDKKTRYSFSDDMKFIRANQGHSVKVRLNLVAIKPPEILYHGTKEAFVEKIRTSGIQKMKRHHVHLSKDLETATKVGARRGIPVILIVEASRMYEDGYVFYCSENGVWLTNHVPVSYIKEYK